MSSPVNIDKKPLVWADDDREAVGAASRSRAIVALFATTLFASAFLMFAAEPMVARMVLPLLGGAPAVWNTCLVFFQIMLLGGYAYAHGATRSLGVRRHVIVHLAVIALPLLALPVALRQPPPDGQNPAAWLLGALLGSIGLPFFVLSTSAAVLQKWFSSTDDDAAKDPYFLYAASNLGSVIALLAYPLIIEPTLRLQDQARVWTIGYAAFALLTVACASVVWRRGRASSTTTEVAMTTVHELPLAWPRQALWIALAFVPSSQLLAVTSYISTDVASVPLMWIAPLALYLLSFVVAFSAHAERARAIAWRLMPLFVVVLTLVLIAEVRNPLAVIIPLHLLAFFVIALACHAQLACDRPSPGHLTEFFFWIAFGGMIGGLFNALLAPVIFNSIVEYPLVVAAVCWLRVVATREESRKLVLADVLAPVVIGVGMATMMLFSNRLHTGGFGILGVVVPALIVFTLRRHPVRFAASIAVMMMAAPLAEGRFGRVVHAERTFFGVMRVKEDPRLGYRFMFHGTTLHGMQRIGAESQQTPLSYYYPTGPIGQVFAAVPQAKAASDVAVVGLGVGSLASYRSPAQRWTYYEIDPAVERIARDQTYFTYLSACGDHCRVIPGDGRLSLVRAHPQQYGVMVLDAFSSDAVPMHLMSREALQLYLSKLAPGGVIAFHISNLHLSFSGILARMAADAGLVTLWQQEPPTSGSWESGKLPSEWIVMARERADFGGLVRDARWSVPTVPVGTPLWTDDFSNILGVLR